jgi:DNA-binding MarR family transcriptional regulator
MMPTTHSSDTIGDPVPKQDLRALVDLLRVLNANTLRLRTHFAGELGLGLNELNALVHLLDAGQLTPKGLARMLSITTGSATAMIDRLENAGFVARRPHPSDRRSLLLDLTPAGRHAMKWVGEQYESAIVGSFQEQIRIPEGTTDFLRKLCLAIQEAADGLDGS